ncbi:MAG: glycine zipper domain-containing protein [Pirellulales bacterium]|nr:glycine zipper domain-containing protein [Pirellulales bacterium]
MTGPSKRFVMRHLACVVLLACTLFASCRSPYYADRGIGLGALTGAGAGAIIGNATGGNAGSGALIGAGLGALTGAAVGTEMDALAAQNRAAIAAQMGRQVQAGAANIQEVIAMTQAGVDPRLIQNYVRTSGVVAPLAASDVIYLHEQGVSTDVIQVMQSPPMVQAPLVANLPPVIVEEYYYGRPACYTPHFGYHHGYHRGRRGRTSFGFSISK